MLPARRPLWLLMMALLCLLGPTGCAADRTTAHPAAEPAELTATRVSPVDIDLTWRTREQGAAGQALEFATAPHGPYTLLQYLPAGQHTYHHRDLIPHTTFYYRLRPYLGTASRAVTVNLPGGRASPDDRPWARPRTTGRPAPDPARTGTAAAAPAGLSATVRAADGIEFHWGDRSADEAGFLLEDRPRGAAAFRVVAVVAPGIDTVGLTTLPDERRAQYRVRSFRYGPASNVVHLTTGSA
ncbi:fibronectin type III domain-containing protein [Streptomyces sp. NPDC050095]|uniref:fibronectin type III domain-containing protein n=1 Tax=unclassified Streptomyces TaxID=2593676 RepID=UPI00343BC5F3